MFNYHIHNFQERLFDVITYGTWIVYFLLLGGILSQEPKYFKIIHEYLPIYISIFLIIRFNPFRRIKFTELDRKIVFSAGIFIITTTLINNIVVF